VARPKVSGLNVARKRRADGSLIEYFYDRRTGTPLGHDRAVALRAIRASEAAEAPVSKDTFDYLITRYLSRPEFRMKLAPRTQRLYRVYLDEMRTRWGDLPFRAFDAGSVEEIKAEFQDRRRKANQIIALFRILLGYAVKLRLIPVNPALRPEMLPTPPRTQVWSYAEEDAFLEAAPPSLRLAMLLLVYTAQRPSDVLAMTKGRVSEHDGRLWIILRQQKTGELIEIPLHDRLAPLVRSRLLDDAGGLLLVPSPTGKPWAYRNFSRSWDAVRQKAGIKDRQRRDGRRTAVVRLAQAGATVPQIASVTGWGIDYCQRIVDTYLPRRSEVAAGAIATWERAGPAEARVVQLGLHKKGRFAE
jgi:integrase